MDDYVLSEHARQQARERGIPLDLVDEIIRNPEDIQAGTQDRTILQGKVLMRGSEYLLRVVVNADEDPMVVITVYATQTGRYGS